MRTLLAILSIIPVFAGDAFHLATGFIAHQSAGRYWAMSSSYRASFDSDGIRLLRKGRMARISFPGARLRWEGEGHAVSQVAFLGPITRSSSAMEAIRAKEAYPGVDIVIRLSQGRLKSEFQLAPGKPVSAVGYCLDGVAVSAGINGRSLHLDAGGGWSWTEEELETWQTDATGRRRPVSSQFVVTDSCVRFQTGALDPALPVTIDPELVFSTYVGGGMFDAINAVATDAQGNTYIGGWTESSDFPSLSGYQNTSAGRIDGFVAKINNSGQLVFSTYLGGSLEDRVQSIAVDASGAIAIAGHTNSTNFPTKLPAQSALSGGRDAFVARLSAGGDQLTFSTYLGGAAQDAAYSVAFDPNGTIVAAGETTSSNFPVRNAYSASNAGGMDGFLTRLTPSGSLLSSTYFGGGGDDRIRGVAVGADNVIHVTGSTTSSNFPVAAAPYPSLRGSMDAFYARLNPTASGLSLSTFLGGTGGSTLSEEAGYGIALDTFGRAWIGGVTPSVDFPGTAAGWQPSYGGGNSDGFVSVFTTSGALEWSTYLGGTAIDAVTAISAGSGFVGLAGYTTSANLPVTGALQTARAGEYDAFWAVFPIASTAPLALSYLGGSGSDSALAVSASDVMLTVGGSTLSANLPLLSPIQSGNAGSFGGFLTRVRLGPGPVAISPSSGSGASQTFTLTATHPSGNANIRTVELLINSSYSFSNGCYIYVDRVNNVVSLYKDAGTQWLNIPIGSSTSVDNGLCALSGSGLTVTSSGNTLTIKLPITFKSPFAGNRNLYASTTDNNGLSIGWSQVGAWAVQSAPSIDSVTPASGSSGSQTFTLSVSDANGNGDIASVSLLVHTAITSFGGCYLSYIRSANTVYLLRDSDQAWLPLPVGSTATIENASCILSGAGLTITVSGNTLTLSLPLSLKPTFTGTKNLYLLVADTTNLTAGWLAAGSWNTSTLPPTNPSINGITPNSGSGGSQTFTLSVSDANGNGDIASVSLLVHTAITSFGGCYLSY
ncbi:MAG: hypothetical protein HYX27_02525, partial [Acidobacteria bacterium]|nr:hypothetical protein [Acidobacteriota bacterium]